MLIRSRAGLKQGLKYSLLLIVLPNLVQSFKKLKQDKTARKELFVKFIKSTLYATLLYGLPEVLFQWALSVGLCPGKRVWLLCSLISAALAYSIEHPSRHITILSYIAQKALETLWGVLERKQMYREKPWHAKFIVLLSFIIIALGQVQEYKKQIKASKEQKTADIGSDSPDPAKPTNEVMTGTLGKLLNF